MRTTIAIAFVLVALTGASAKKPKSVTVTNFPATQSVQVENFPATQPVQVENFPATQSVNVQNFPPSAAPLAPSKPSQIVTLTYDNFCAGTTSLVNVIDTQIMPDGTTQPFTIPQGRVLVVTGLDWSASRCPPLSAPGTVGVYVFLGATGRVAFNDYATIGAGTSPGSSCSTGGKASVVPNLVVKPGTELCAGYDNTTFGGAPGIVHGFLADDE